MKKVTAAVLSYNYEQYIEQRIDSVLQQTYPISELLILDDHSTDKSPQIIQRKIEKIKKQYPDLKVRCEINKKNSGNVSKQWAKAFELATGDFVWLCEADDLCSSKFLETVMPSFDNRKVIMSYAESFAINEYDDLIEDNLKHWHELYKSDRWDNDFVYDGKKEVAEILAAENTIPNVSGVVFRNDSKINFAKYIKKAQKYRLAGDWYFYSKVLLHGKIAYHSEPLNCHRMHSDSVFGSMKDHLHLEEEYSVQKEIQKDVKVSAKTKKLIAEHNEVLETKCQIEDDGIKVSILVPICNVEKYLEQCLDSLVNQTLKEIEIICINDGSTDNSLKIIKKYAKQDKRIVIIDKKNSGYGDSMNQGLAKARGEYIGILESDDFIELDAYAKMYAQAKEFNAEVVRANYYHYKGNIDTKYSGFAKRQTGRLLDPAIEPQVFLEPPAIWSAIYRNDFVRHHEIKFLPTPGASYQDTSFNFKVLASAHSVVLMDEAFIHYRLDNETSSVNQPDKINFVSTEYAEIERFLRDNRLMMNLGGLMEWTKFRTYYWNLQRMTPELAVQFIETIRQEFKQAEKEGLVQKVYFRTKEKLAYDMIMDLDSKKMVSLIKMRKKLRGGK